MDVEVPIQTKIEEEVQEEQEIKQRFVLPGQIYKQTDQPRQYNSSVFLQTEDALTSMYAGFPSISAKNNITTLVRFPVQYLPMKNDLIIGVIKIRTAETFIVDIAAPLDALLGGLEFDGVTKRNKPNLKVGAIVFCRVVEYSKYTGGKLSCINKGFSSKKNNQMGELKEGYVFWLPQYKHQLIQTQLLQKLGKCAKFEVAFGKNGRIWLNSAKPQNIMLISNLFKLVAENAEQGKINAMISLIQ